MKKHQINCRDRIFFCLRRTCLLMKLTLFFICVSLFQVSANVYSQTQRLSIRLQNASIKEVLNEIEEKSDIKFLYKDKSIENRQVSIDAQNKPLDEILDAVLKETGNSYRIMDNNLIIISPGNTLQSDFNIKGKVTDSSGLPLPGVSVVIKGTSRGVITAADGNYFLPNVPGNAGLVFSFVGMRTLEIAVAGKTSIDVQLEDELVDIEEVVAIGYISQKKTLLTGSVEKITVSEELKNIPTVSAGTILSGSMSGVSVSTPKGIPGVNPDISIRTGSSWNSQPVTYVIDGIIRESADFNNLSPNEIEDVTVLKDAASAAVYGSRSAGGVILVTTRRGKSGKPEFNYSFNRGVDTRSKNVELTSAVQAGEIFNRINGADWWAWSDEELEHYQTINKGWGYDQLDAVWRDPSIQTHNFSVSGGSEKVKYFAGASYVDQKGFLEPLTFKKYNFRLNTTIDLTQNFQVFAGMSLINSKRGNLIWEGEEALYRKLLVWQPDQPVYTDGGQYVDYGWIANVGAMTRGDGGYNRTQYLNPEININATYNVPFLKGLSIKGAYGTNWSYEQYSGFYKNYPMMVMKREGSGNHIIHTDDESILSTKMSSWQGKNAIEKEVTWGHDYQMNFQVNYKQTFDKHAVQGALVYEKAEIDGASVYGGRETFPVYLTDQFWAASGARADTWGGGDAYLKTGRVSYIGQFNYAYAGKYLVDFSFREDGSMKFAPGQRWGFFPAGAIGWVLSEEPFFKKNAVSYLKFRFSAGLTGNDAVGGWQWQESYSLGNSAYLGTSPSPYVGIKYGSVVNPGLTWEKSLTYNGGVDMNFGRNWNTSVDYWFRKSYDILGARVASVPTTFSLSLPDENYGQINAQGFDLSVGYRKQTPDFTYYGNFNISYGWNKVIQKDYAENAQPIDIEEGKSRTYIQGYEFDQIIRTQEQLEAFNTAHPGYKIGGLSPELGMMVYKDLSGPDGTPDNIINSWDRVILNKSNFPIVYGLKLGGSWKGFSLETMFNGKLKQQKSFRDLAGGVEWNRMWRKWYTDSWTQETPDASLPKRISANSSNTYDISSRFWYEDASFIRLKYINFGYTLPKMFFGGVVDKVRVYFAGSNLFVLSNFKHYDPELGGGTEFPIMRTFNFGLDVKF